MAGTAPYATRCACRGPLHLTSCWWCVYNDDGRPQATGDPEIDEAVDPYRPESLDEFEFVGSLPFDPSVVVRLHKVGGGTLGRSYEGVWYARIEVPLEDPIEGRFSTGMPHTHSEAAVVAADLLLEGED